MSGAGEALRQAAFAALGPVEGIGVYDAPPLQAVVPYALVELGPETGWSHKSGPGRELRLAVQLRDEGERPVRLRRLVAETEAALAELPGQLPGWQLVTMHFLRSRMVPPGRRGERGWRCSNIERGCWPAELARKSSEFGEEIV